MAKKSSIGNSALATSFLFLILLALGIAKAIEYLLVPPSVPHRVPIVTGGPVASRQAEFKRRLKAMAKALGAALSARGVVLGDVSKMAMEPRETDSIVWLREELAVRISGRPGALAREIRSSLSGLEGVSFSLRAEEKNRVVLSVRLDGLETHRVTIFSSTPAEKPLLSIVIDDIGYAKENALGFIELGIPLTFGVLPGGPYSKELAQRARQVGKEVIVHLPLEPERELQGDFPEVIIRQDEPVAVLRSRIREALLKVPGAVGANNHLGSKFTKEREPMMVLFEELQSRNLFFLDCRTTSESIALAVAKEVGLPAVQRHVFLDDTPNYASISAQLERAQEIAKEKGGAVAVGRPHPLTLEVLRDMLPRLGSMGVEMALLSDVVAREERLH